ncbi:hypothetical protein [Lactococcus kimchii]|uniref:hypothetical protein n=1 Tax=Lactococcus sp. S-13 TaxID=2507158 RepID=UPI001023A9D0|nr:hypothetical protein [Lactococcus sp. S-13]RZI47998.1 hypothetical protein EQJ87_00205 [Lactococcus sp. S-13]RZI49830.1 hypothetical protein EQJ87_10555 [Lactococcus sp. S-13]
MKLKTEIRHIPDTDWLAITVQSTDHYQNYIGRAPKALIKGPVLNYDVLGASAPIQVNGYTVHRFLVSWRYKETAKK